MEAAPLTTAHALARDVAHHLPKTTLVAVEHHQAAAQEFSKAAEGTGDTEALRILKLLEQHHRQIAGIIKSQSYPRQDEVAKEQLTSALPAQKAKSSSQTPGDKHGASSQTASTAVQRDALPVSQRHSAHELSSSIASNLATARGIPRSQQQRARHLSPATSPESAREDVAARRLSPNLPRPNSIVTGAQASPTVNPQTARQPSQPSIESPVRKHEMNTTSVPLDDRFQKFYSTFEGLLSKISAPLAFAGLPLIPEDETHTQKPASPKLSQRATTTDNTDITRLFSKAALRAVKDTHGPNYTFGPSGVQESFFVVPTTYAGVLARGEQPAVRQQHPLETSLSQLETEEEAEQFIDARENPQSETSPEKTRRRSVTVEWRAASRKTVEELEMENQSLKQLTDNLSKRLYMWEKSAQSQTRDLNASIRSLGQQSFAQMPPSAPGAERMAKGTEKVEEEHTRIASMTAKATVKTVDEGDVENARIKELEEQIKAANRELEKYGRENEKLKSVVIRYREKWDKLKEGARVRREATVGGNVSGGGSGDAT